MSPATKTKEKPVEAEVLREEPPAQPLVPVASAPTPRAAAQFAAILAQCPKLAEALVKAIVACRPVPHDARNEHHKYDYTSSEAVIGAARDALSANGLAVIPMSQQVNGHEREGADRFELVSQRLLLHTSGESVVCTSAWPITPGAGRPLDKATAAADTLSLRYFLRNLLQMPCADPVEDVSARDDTKVKPAAQPQKAAAQKTAAKLAALPATGKELLERLTAYDDKLHKTGVIKQGELLSAIQSWGREQGLGDEIKDYLPAAFADVAEEVKKFEARARAAKSADVPK